MKVEVVLLLLLFAIMASLGASIHNPIGINYGLLGDNLPSTSQSIYLVQSLLKVPRVKLYEPRPDILQALSNTNIQVTIMVPNQAIPNISLSQNVSDSWVKINLLPFYPKTRIQTLLVGNEVLSDPSIKTTWSMLVPAMRNLKYSLRALDVGSIKVGTTLAMDTLESSFPPSNGTFRSDIAVPVIKPLLQFLNKTKSFYFVDVYPYFAWAANYKSINLNYTLFMNGSAGYKDPFSGLVYTNLLDQQLDAVASAMAKLGYPNIRITIAETGWPNAGDLDQIGANVYNAAHYNRNFVRKLRSNMGTPMRPNQTIFAYIFSLYNENLKGGPGTERHWGLLYPNGSRVYEVDLTGRTPNSKYAPLPEPKNNEPYKGKIWCVVAPGANFTALGPALSYACSQANDTCNAIQRGKKCFMPNTLVSHASYAFNSYWQMFRGTGGTCFFNGLAVQTAINPSYGSCKFPTLSPS
ncbi:hypothetical protein AMTRI_Chr06g195220 [Amborella trichopoda]